MTGGGCGLMVVIAAGVCVRKAEMQRRVGSVTASRCGN